METFRSTLKAIVIIAFGFILAAVLVEVFVDNDEPTSSYEPDYSTTYEQDDVFEDAFVAGCVEEAPGEEAYCQCVWNEMRQDYSEDQLLEISGGSEQEIMREMMPYVESCISRMSI